MKIFCTYKTVSKPLGGANSFISALYSSLNNLNCQLVYKFDKDVDLIFINQLSRGHGRGTLSLFFLIYIVIKAYFHNIKIFTRVVNLNRHAFKKGPRYFLFGYFSDLKTYFLIYISHKVIFQSNYQKSFFVNNAPFFITKELPKYHVIHNGSEKVFYSDFCRKLRKNDKLILVSNTFSSRITKMHNLIAEFSLVPNVEVYHIGNWPREVDPQNVKLVGILSKGDIISFYQKAHFLLHTAVKDPCPNVIFEAILNGLPVIFNPDIGSSSEIVMNNGIALNSSNILDTVEHAFTSYNMLIENIGRTKEYYLIDRAFSNYNYLFNSVL